MCNSILQIRNLRLKKSKGDHTASNRQKPALTPSQLLPKPTRRPCSEPCLGMTGGLQCCLALLGLHERVQMIIPPKPTYSVIRVSLSALFCFAPLQMLACQMRTL